MERRECGEGGAARAGTPQSSSGLAPIAAGLVLAGGLAVLQVSGGRAVWAAAIVATVVLLRWPRLNPLFLFAASGALFGLAACFGR